MATHIATPDLCHEGKYRYEQTRLPYEWIGRKFVIPPGSLLAQLVTTEDEEPPEGTPVRWNITETLANIINSPLAVYEDMVAEVSRLRDQNQEYERTLATKDVALKDREKAHRDLEDRVVRIALEYGERHDWCDTVVEALEEMGLEVPQKRYSFTLSVVYRVEGTKETYGTPDAYGVRRELDLEGMGIDVVMDEWEDVQAHAVDFDVMDVEEVRE